MINRFAIKQGSELNRDNLSKPGSGAISDPKAIRGESMKARFTRDPVNLLSRRND